MLSVDRRGDDDRGHRGRRGADATSSACWRIRASRTRGYLLLGIVAANTSGKAAILFYLLAYAVTNLGAFGVVALLGTARAPARRAPRLRRPVERSRPALAALMTVFLLSLGGFPPTAGFIAQVVHLQRRGPGRLLLARDHRRAHERRLGVLLPAHRGDDVHDRGTETLRPRVPGRRRWPAWRSRCIASVLSRHPADARPRSGAGFDLDDLLILQLPLLCRLHEADSHNGGTRSVVIAKHPTPTTASAFSPDSTRQAFTPWPTISLPSPGSVLDWRGSGVPLISSETMRSGDRFVPPMIRVPDLAADPRTSSSTSRPAGSISSSASSSFNIWSRPLPTYCRTSRIASRLSVTRADSDFGTRAGGDATGLYDVNDCIEVEHDRGTTSFASGECRRCRARCESRGHSKR